MLYLGPTLLIQRSAHCLGVASMIQQAVKAQLHNCTTSVQTIDLGKKGKIQCLFHGQCFKHFGYFICRNDAQKTILAPDFVVFGGHFIVRKEELKYSICRYEKGFSSLNFT